ncbi:MAG: TraR/DksA C4-type zinc finger protein [Bdellovibrionales bacterium]|nr:TraR/DksA C4-type zinc finger protein [Bdellovibrionales bacterium]
MSSNIVRKELIEECKTKLVALKSELLNQFITRRSELSQQEFRGDEIDLSSSIMAENDALLAQNRIRHQLMEIEFALSRIDSGQFGRCEETDEPIEEERLRAIPWTRLSIEGAELREALSTRRKF